MMGNVLSFGQFKERRTKDNREALQDMLAESLYPEEVLHEETTGRYSLTEADDVRLREVFAALGCPFPEAWTPESLADDIEWLQAVYFTDLLIAIEDPKLHNRLMTARDELLKAHLSAVLARDEETAATLFPEVNAFWRKKLNRAG